VKAIFSNKIPSLQRILKMTSILEEKKQKVAKVKTILRWMKYEIIRQQAFFAHVNCIGG
jgi:hypothetical protein